MSRSPAPRLQPAPAALVFPWSARFGVALAASLLLLAPVAAHGQQPLPIVFDTDMGNDVDDALALAMIHSLQSRGECQLLAVTVTKDDDDAAAYIDAVNTFYGYGDTPIGVCRSGITPQPSKFNVLARARDNGQLRYPHDLTSKDQAEDAVPLLRRLLAAAEDGSVAMIQVGFSTNFARLLDSPADQHSPLVGRDLVAAKVKLLSIMAGAFTQIADGQGQLHDHREYNVTNNIAACQHLARVWPTPIWWSGFEIGLALPYPHQSILNDFQYVPNHPVAEAYHLYSPPPHDRPTWDLTSVLIAVRPDHGYFQLSQPGHVSVADDGLTSFTATDDGRDRYLVLDEAAKPRILEALQLLSSEPPKAAAGRP